MPLIDIDGNINDKDLDNNFDFLLSEINNLKSTVSDLNLNKADKSEIVRQIDLVASNIVNDTAGVSGYAVSNALLGLKNRIDNLVLESGTGDTEVVDARFDSVFNTTYTVLTNRLDAMSQYAKDINTEVTNARTDTVYGTTDANLSDRLNTMSQRELDNSQRSVYTITDVTNTNDYVGNITGLTLFDDLRLDLEVVNPNTGSATLDIGDSSGAKSIKFINSQGDKADLPAGELFGVNVLKYDGIDWIVLKNNIKNNKIDKIGGSFVEKMLNLMRVRGMYAYVSGTDIKIGVGLNDELESVVEYTFKYNSDNLLLLRGVSSGVEDSDNTDVVIDATLTGTFVTSSPPNTYTTTPGDSFTSIFSGYKNVKFTRIKETRGGIWEFKIFENGTTTEEKERVILSCYGDATARVESNLFSDLDPLKEYELIGTFLGDDPNHPPSSSPSRGYINYNASDATARPVSPINIVKPLDVATSKQIVSSNSIPDFAIIAKPSGAAYAKEWVPIHSGVSGVSLNVTIKLILDGITNIITPGGIPAFTYMEIENFNLIQGFEAHNPNGADGAMWYHIVNHAISVKKPYLSIQNSLDILQSIEVDKAYLGMLPSAQTNMDKLVLNDGTIIEPIPTDGSSSSYDFGLDSAMYVGEFVAGNYHASAIDVSSLREACSLGKTYEPTSPFLATFRADNVTKFYFTSIYDTTTLPAGERISCEQRICCISGVRFPNTQMGSMY